MEKPFENVGPFLKQCMSSKRQVLGYFSTQSRKHMSMYIQEELWIDSLGGPVAAYCITTEGIRVQDFNCSCFF